MILLLILIGFFIFSALYDTYKYENLSEKPPGSMYTNVCMFICSRLFKMIGVLLIIYLLILYHTSNSSTDTFGPVLSNIATELVYRVSLFFFTVGCVLALSNE